VVAQRPSWKHPRQVREHVPGQDMHMTCCHWWWESVAARWSDVPRDVVCGRQTGRTRWHGQEIRLRPAGPDHQGQSIDGVGARDALASSGPSEWIPVDVTAGANGRRLAV
jgi:hypothetical protein